MATFTATPDSFDDYAEATIHHKVNDLIGRYGYQEHDRDDLEQDLRLWVLGRLDGFEPTQVQRNTYISRLIDQRIADMIRARKRICRDSRRESCLLDEQDRPTNNLDQLPGRASVPSRILDLRMDLNATLARLSERQQSICALLSGHTKEAIKRSLGIPRRSFDADLREIRRAFGQAGLDAYLN